jgi:hypothetical protein
MGEPAKEHGIVKIVVDVVQCKSRAISIAG